MSVEIDFDYYGIKVHASLVNADDAQRAMNFAKQIAGGLCGDPPKKSAECEFCHGVLFVGFRGMDAPCLKCNTVKAWEWFNDRLEKAAANFEGLPTKDAWEDAKRTIDELTHERDMARKQLTEAREALERALD